MTRQSHITAIILAAGHSRRMGGDKLFIEIAGKPVLLHSYEHARQAGPDAVVIVSGDNIADIAGLIPADENTGIIPCETAALGMSESLKAGLLAAGPQTDAALILLADQPLISSRTIAEYLRKFRAGHRLIAGRYSGTTGCPALFHRAYWGELLRLSGDHGARDVLQRHDKDVITIPIPHEQIPDIDTAEDLEKVRQILAG